MATTARANTVISGALSVFVLLFGSTLATTQARAQAVDIPAIVQANPKAPNTIVMAQYGYQFEADVDDDSEIEKQTALFGVSHRIDFDEELSFFALGTYTFYGYDIDSGVPNSRQGVANYRWDDVHRGVLAGILSYQVDEDWQLFGGALVRTWGEGGADFEDTLTGGALIGFDWAASDNLSLGLIVGAFSQLEDSAAIMPVPTIDWRFAEGWRFYTGLVSVFDPGVGAELTWQVVDELQVGAGLTFQNRRFRLDSRTPSVAGVRSDDDGVAEERSTPVFATVRWRPTQKVMVDLLGGVTIGGQLRVESDTGGQIAEHDYDPAPFVGLRGTIAF